jgi:acetyl esterase/lipase
MREIIADCFDAARYIAHFAEKLNIDKKAFVVSGHSAGAHLALMLAYAPNEEFQDDYEFTDTFTVKAAAVMSPPTMLHDSATYHLHDLDDLFIGEPSGEKERTSPITYVTTYSPPTFLSAGTCDYLVFATSAEKLYQKLVHCGASAELLLSIGGGHSFEKIYNSIEPNVTLKDIQEEIIRFVLAHVA